MSKDDKGAAARAAFTRSTEERKADNAAAAREEAEKNRPPVVCLGREGNQYVLYSTAYKRVERLTAEKLNLPNLRAIAPRTRWEAWLFPERVAAGDEVKRGELVEAVQERILSDCGAKMFDSSRVHGRGVWPDPAGGWVYNAGASCWFIPADGGQMEQIDHVRGDYVYSAGVALPSPADTPLSDEEGRRLLELMCARSWVLPGAGDIMAGWMVAAMLAGVMPICPHVWINAPAGTGKSTFRDDLRSIFGEATIDTDGGHTTDTGIRQEVAGVALPVVIDEAEGGDDEKAQKNIKRWIELMRLASYGGKITHGSVDGTPRKYYIKCSFALFSVANSIERAADSSRCLVLDLKKYREDEQGKAEKEALWARQEEGIALVKTTGFQGRLMARLLALLPVIMGNVAALGAHLRKVEGADARRAELFAVLLACCHALVSCEPMNQEAIQEAAGLMLAYGEQEEKESDFSRCLGVLLGHVVRVRGQEMTVADACQALTTGHDAEIKDSIAYSLSAVGLRWRNDLNVLQVDKRADKMKRIYATSQWSNGKITNVLAEGCREKGEKKANAAGVWIGSAKWGGGNPIDCIMIPAALVLGEDD